MAVGLSRDDWAEAALGALEREGFAAVAVEPLARRLGATKGSFYWHFRDRADLVAATLARWERRDTDEVIKAVESVPGSSARRLDVLLRRALAEGEQPGCEAAVMAAAADPAVGAVLERVTAKRLAYLERLFSQLGLDADRAGRRAKVAYALYLGIGELRRLEAGRGRSLSEAEVEALVEESSRLLGIDAA